MIALLGRRDTPVDGVEDYCSLLSRALVKHQVDLKLVRVRWFERGWIRALLEIRRDASSWRGLWVLIQHTPLGWSRRGFPLGALLVVQILRMRGAKCAVMYHEPCGVSGPRLVDRVRCVCQNWVLRRLHDRSERSIFADPLDRIPWLKANDAKATFIPIGANIPEPSTVNGVARDDTQADKSVAVFCLSNPPNVYHELDDILRAVRFAAEGKFKIRVTFLGRGTTEARGEIARAFQGTAVEVETLGIRDSSEVSRILAESHVMLCVRGPLYSRRGSAIAGIACGLPIVGYGGAADGTPLAEAGLLLVPPGDRDALGTALARILDDTALHAALKQRSLSTHARFFSWNVIAAKFCNALDGCGR